ncbi:MAG: hypothetical protein KGL92_03975, partial [Gammaproteobacteria bacterium]|nr:hypothetical protein [Gammaproteobacteria bacterium]
MARAGASAATVAADTDPTSADTLNEIVVTARRERQQYQFATEQSVKTLDRDQIRASSTVGGVAAAMMLVPGVSTSTYGATGSSKSTISINGIKIGW